MGRIALSPADHRLAFALLGAVALVPLGVQSEYWLGVLITGLYFAMLAQNWNLLAGITGLFSMAPSAFAMVGAYTTGLLSHHLGIGPWVGIPAGAVVSAVVGFGLGRITLRLRGAYLALTTLAFSEILRLVVANSIEWTRGDLGLSVPGILGGAKAPILYLFLGVLAAYQVLLMLLLRSRVGLFLLAIRDDEVGAVARGVDVVRYKTLAFTLSAAGCGIAGALFVHFLQLASPELGLILQTGLVISMVVIGGMGTATGPLVGALLVQVASEALREVGVRHLLVFSALVILVGRFFREGLMGLLARRRSPARLVARPASDAKRLA
ncbi:MAG TPA: branched-chain amino acid ABC transporter permease [Candidatus Binatia bacterium]|nr:branched-chain amino acid ABC transporter permease [Candidatus Binatia bacterium]